MPPEAVRPRGASGSRRSPSADGTQHRPGFQPGLLWLQSPSLEDLAETLWSWWSRYPAQPLEEEVVLVPSNGMAEWFKAESSRLQGIFSGPRVELPARFAWRLYRTTLGPSVQLAGRLGKGTLPWLMLAHSQAWTRLPPVQDQLRKAGLIATTDPELPVSVANGIDFYRWCSHAADLFDQYQLFRQDWLSDWAEGHARLRAEPDGLSAAQTVPPEHAWQVQLWAWLSRHADRDPLHDGPSSRAAVHQACIELLRHAPANSLPPLPARVILFGTTSLPPMVMDLLEALSRHIPVVMAIPNPCQVQWVDLFDAPHEGQPLLAAWGRQARDFIDQVERFDERLATLEQRRMTRVEQEATGAARSALVRLQASIHRNEPLHEVASDVASRGVKLSDGSIQFVRAHTALREVEILHDHLLHRLTSEDTDRRPQPRDVVVMVPNLKTHAAAIRAVFGAYGEKDPRHIPWGIADQLPAPDQGLHELAAWLLSLPAQRCSAADLRRLLESPSVGKRWVLDDEDRRRLQDWVEASGIRWGLSAAHRESLGLGAAGTAMTWQFGVDRMLAGYAAGTASSAGWAPLEGVKGLAAHAAGQLAGLLRRLESWRLWALQPHEPREWAAAFRQLWSDMVEAADAAQERDCASLEAAISQWLRHTQEAGFSSPIGHELAHLAILEQLEQPAAPGRFRASGVTFCTLMPLRAVPFRLVCLLGMEDGQYPRPTRPRPGDLMALSGLARPGDRSRRTDDRQLMLDALLSAREHLYISWVGQQATDNQHRPPSVLVGQLRDALAAIWGAEAVESTTVDHPLQPFNRAYFHVGDLPRTHAHEWQPSPMEKPGAHRLPVDVPVERPIDQGSGSACAPGMVDVTAGSGALLDDPARILGWLKCPVTAFWHERLGVRWPRSGKPLEADEPLEWGGMQEWSAWDDALERLMQGDEVPSASSEVTGIEQWAHECLSALQQRGLMPLGAPGRLVGPSMVNGLWAMRAHLRQLRGDHRRHRVLWSGSRFAAGQPFAQEPSPWRLHVLVEAWWLQTQAAAQGHGFDLHLLAPDVIATAQPSCADQARRDLEEVAATLMVWMRADEPRPATSRLVAAARRSASQQSAALSREAERNAAWRRSFGGEEAWTWKEWGHARPVQQWIDATQALYGPFWRWCAQCLQVRPIRPATVDPAVSDALVFRGAPRDPDDARIGAGQGEAP